VAECSKVPVIKHYKGVCHVYVDGEADLAMAEEIALNASCSVRPSATPWKHCWSTRASRAGSCLPWREAFGEECRNAVDDHSRQVLASDPKSRDWKIRPASDQDYFTEYNDYILNVRVVNGVREAIDHVKPLRLGSLG